MEFENVVLLTVDALRADHTGFHGYKWNTTPFLDGLAENNLVFTRCYSNSSHTREAVPSMITGKYPDEAIAPNYNLRADSIPSMIEQESGAFHSNPFISRAYDYDTGFDTFDDDLNIGKNKIFTIANRMFQKLTNRHYARAEKINSRSLDWIPEKNFFLWNHYMDVHGPYEPPREYQEMFRDSIIGNRKSQMLLQKARKTPGRITEDDHQALVDLYDAEIRYTDDQIREFLDSINLEDTLVIITADHGEAFGEDGFYEHPRTLSEGLLHVPMILVHDELDGEVDVPVSLQDVAPTVVKALGGELEGKSLLEISADPDEYRDRVVYSQVRLKRSDKRKFYARGIDDHHFLEGDSSGEITWDEENDSSIREDLRSHALERLKSFETVEEEDEKEKEIKQRLEVLGYGGDKTVQ